MIPEVQLIHLVDLAISDVDSGAVNFTHLRTLLLGILKLTNHEYSSVDPKVFGNSSQAVNKKSLIDSNVKIADENIKDDDCCDQDDFMTKIKKLECEQINTKNELKSIQTILESYSSYPSNEEVISRNNVDKVKEDEGQSGIGDNDKSYLRNVWQNKKLMKRLDTLEEATDKLFSLLDALLAENKNLKQDQEVTFLDEPKNDYVLLKDSVDTNTNDIDSLKSTLDSVNLKNNDHASANIQRLDNLDEAIKNLSEQLQEIQTKVEETPGKDLNQKQDSGLDISHLASNKSEDMLTNASNTHSNMDDVSQSFEDMELLKARVSQLEKQLGSHQGESSAVNSDELKNLRKEINSFDAKLQQLNENVNDTHALKSDLDAIHGKVVSNTADIDASKEKIETLQQSVTNFANSDIKNIIDNIEELKKMSDEIDELRKLSQLKNLADNVEDLKGIKEAIDTMKKDISENEGKLGQVLKSLEELLSQTNLLHESNIQYEQEINNLKDLSKDQMKIPVQEKEQKDEGFGKMSHENLSHVQGLEKQIQDVHLRMNEIASIQDRLLQAISSENHKPPVAPAFDASVLAAIQHLAQQNRQQIAELQADLTILRKVNTATVDSTAHHPSSESSVGVVDNDSFEQFLIQLNTLQDEQIRLSGHMANTFDDMKNEFNRKQKHIDALYEYIDKLQHNKADKGDVISEMDVKADKHALDGKVNMSTFDERYQLLEQALKNTLDRLNQYVNEESNLKGALNKLTEDMNSKMDSDAEKKLKKFLEGRLNEIQSSRTNLPDQMMDLRNAAGLRKPMPLSYHCISCDRPIDVTARGVMPPVPQNFPSKKTLGPYTSYELDQIRQARRTPQGIYDKGVTVNRPCGGHHTTVNPSMYRSQKHMVLQADATADKPESNDLSIVDCVLGKDGQIYRGRFKQSERPPPLPKKIPYQTQRNKFYNRQFMAHSATTTQHEKNSTAAELNGDHRSHSASALEKHTSQRNDLQKLEDSPAIILPPISRDGSLVSADEDKMSSSVTASHANLSV